MKNLLNYIEEIDDLDISESIRINKKDINHQAIKTARKQSREEEIAAHGKPISFNRTFKDKSKYTRKEKHKNKYFVFCKLRSLRI